MSKDFKLPAKGLHGASNMLDDLNRELQLQMSIARDQFCSRLMAAGLGPDKVKIIETTEVVQDETQFSITAVYRDTGHPVNMDDLKEQNPEESLSIWEDPVFITWFNSRPEQVRELIRKMPPDQAYRHPSCNALPVQLYSYDEGKTGELTLSIVVHDPERGGRVVSNVNPADLTPYWPKKDKE